MDTTRKNKDGVFVFKDDTKHLVTGPVAIPDCPDCDFQSGEKILTPDEIEGMAHWFNTKSRMSDPMHLYANDQETVIGETVESWTTKEVTRVTNIDGKEVTLPIGTWMATVKVTDDDTWQEIESGRLRGFSAMYVPRSDAEKLLASKRTLIADLEDPVPLTISIVDKPCVYDAIFTSIKEEAGVVKAGRRISNATLSKINKIVETMKAGYDEIQTIINVAEIERQPKESTKEDISMDKDELKTIVKEAIKEETNPLWEQLESLKQEPEVEPEEGEEPEVEVKLEDNEVIKGLQDEIKALKETIGERPGNSIKGQERTPEPDPTPTVVKGVFEDRDVFGRKKGE